MSQFFASSGQKIFRKKIIDLIKAVFNAVVVLNKVGVDWGERNSSEANSNSSKLLKLSKMWASLVAQWSRICLQMQEKWV